MDLSAYDILATAVLLIDTQGRVVHANVAAEEMLGVSRKILHGAQALSLFDDDDVLLRRFPQALRGEHGVLKQTLVTRRRAGEIPVNMTLLPLSDLPWQALMELRPVERDQLLDRHHAMTKERSAQRALLRNLAHEIKNPLGGIRGAAQLLDSELAGPGHAADSGDLREYTQVIVAETRRLGALIDRLIAPQGQALRLSRFNIHEVCERVHTLVRAEFTEQFDILRDYDSSVPDMLGDFERLVQTLLNMARNAGQALTESLPANAAAAALQAPAAGAAGHGQRWQPDEPPRLLLRTRIGHCLYLPHTPGSLAVIISVIDNGPGVPDELRETIFHPLATGRPQGTGLGLNLAQEYAQQHGGLIEFESRPGYTEFRLILPLEVA